MCVFLGNSIPPSPACSHVGAFFVSWRTSTLRVSCSVSKLCLCFETPRLPQPINQSFWPNGLGSAGHPLLGKSLGQWGLGFRVMGTGLMGLGCSLLPSPFGHDDFVDGLMGQWIKGLATAYSQVHLATMILLMGKWPNGLMGYGLLSSFDQNAWVNG